MTLDYESLRVIWWLLLGVLGNILFEWVCMKMVWPEEGPSHSVAMVEAELAYLDRDFSEGVFIRHPALFARDLAEAVNAKVYKDWRLAAKALDLERRAALAGGTAGFAADARELSQGFHDYLLSGVLATEVYAIRLAVMVVEAVAALALQTTTV